MASVLIAGLAGVWLWVAINMDSAPFPLRWAKALLLRLPRGKKFVGCPWCLGFWAAGSAYIALVASQDALDPLATPVGVLAAAGVCGLLGSNLAAIDEE